MSRSDPQRRTTLHADQARREAWEELLLRRLLQTQSGLEAAPDERWQHMSRRIAAYEQRRTVDAAIALRGCELRNRLMLSHPWPSLMSLFG